MKRSTGENLGRITVSVGVASLHRGENVAALIERADNCLYAAKRNRAQSGHLRGGSRDQPAVARPRRVAPFPVRSVSRHACSRGKSLGASLARRCDSCYLRAATADHSYASFDRSHSHHSCRQLAAATCADGSILAKEQGRSFDEGALEQEVRKAVIDIVGQQIECRSISSMTAR